MIGHSGTSGSDAVRSQYVMLHLGRGLVPHLGFGADPAGWMLTFAHYWGIDEVGIFVIPALAAYLLSAMGGEASEAGRRGEEKRAEEEVAEATDVD